LDSAHGKKGGQSTTTIAHLPFIIFDWGGRLRNDRRWQCGAPPAGNADFALMQLIVQPRAGGGTPGALTTL
jgi:type I restriction enzyme M protein